VTEKSKPQRKCLLKRPRSVFLGDWNQEELGELGGLVGEVYHFYSFEEAHKDVVLEEVDLVIARNAGLVRREESNNEMAPRRSRTKAYVHYVNKLRKQWLRWTCDIFLVHFGGSIVLPKTPRISGGTLSQEKCRHRELLVTGQPGELQDLARTAIKACKDGREFVFWTDDIQPTGPHSASIPKPIDIEEWFVQTDEGGAPAFHWFDEQEKRRGMLVLQEPLCRSVTELKWLAAVLRLWHEKAPDSFPDVITWEDDLQWQTTDERRIAKELNELHLNREAALAEFAQQEADLRTSFERAKTRADQAERRLLTTQGDELVEAVEAALGDLGFVSKPPDDEATKHKKEDLLVTRDEWPEWEASVEVKGKARSGAKGNEATKLGVRRDARGTQQAILFVNGEFSKAPSHRGSLFSNNQEVISMVKDVGVLVVDTRDLYQALFDEQLRQELVSAMKNKAGAYPNHIEEPEAD
tara:strand:- start:5423 stop:6823 length:1401 start_codon:yes stop_codon:yes gene_type:complete